MAERNSNLRKLAAAFAQGKLDKARYRNLRMKQLSALDFDKPVPDLPPDIANIRIPKQGEAPFGPPKKSNTKLILVIIILVLAICTLSYFLIAK